ncbi:MAG TPA: hypothetical protein VGS07_11755 [Thermoanaerobaculia bacterium]|jgi:hypothetical protein|nr:hypothetical protein [Thermoanaerobaculia bacterium]
MNLRRALLWTLFGTSLAVSLPATLSAGTVITLKEQSAQGSSDNKIYLDGGKLRFEAGSAGPTHVILYHTANGSLQILDPAKKTWFEMAAGASAASQQAAATKRVMEDKKLTPARKQMILNNMKANSARHGLFGGPAVPAQYNKVASGVTVNGFTADQYEVVLGGVKTREVWLADPKSLGIDAADAVALKSMAERIAASAGRSPAGFGLETGSPRGVPVRTISFVNGQKSTTTDLSAIAQQDVAATLFEVPKDFKQAAPGAPVH